MKEFSNEIVIYQNSEGNIKLDVLLNEETVWLTQEQMSELFQRDRTVITKHIANIFEEGELVEESNVHFLHIANSDKPVKHYNLDVIISVGYRVKSVQGTQFRIWATQRLKEYIVKGFALNDVLVEQYLAFAETMAQQHKPMYMVDWIQKLDDILKLNGRELLTHAGKISHEMAMMRSAEEYGKYQEEKRLLSKELSLKELEEDVKHLKVLKRDG